MMTSNVKMPRSQDEISHFVFSKVVIEPKVSRFRSVVDVPIEVYPGPKDKWEISEIPT